MKKHSGGLGNFLNALTQTAEKNEVAEEKIIYIDIDEIESNPQNFYGLRNIEELAGLIAVSKLIEPLTVIKKSDGKYKLISGHRRRAAVQKLLEDGIYTERKLPCIIKTPKKIRIEQESGEVIEFDENAVEMLNLIASNRGQREERTVEEKLQEVKYLEKFARALYYQKEKRKRGRFVNFFAEEILNISKSQLLRMNLLEKLTPNLKQAIDKGKISETAALEIATLSPQEQELWLEKILAGVIKGTVQEIQNLKKPMRKLSAAENFLPMAEKNTVRQIMDVPEKIENPQNEAEEWIYLEKLSFYEKMYAESKRRSTEEPNELKAAQWEIRASVVQCNIEELKLQHKNRNKNL